MIDQGSSTQRIERWMTGVVLGPGTPAGGLRLCLSHAPIDGQRLLRTWELDSIPEQQAFRDLVQEIDSTAAEEARELGLSTQRFILRATSTEGRELGSLSLRYAATTSVSGEPGFLLDSEPATREGQVALSMRHTNTAFQLLGDGYRTILDVLNRRFAEQDRQLERSQEAQSKVYETMAELAEKRFEREVFAETKKKELEIELHREIAQLDRSQMLMKLGIERVAPLIPALMNRVLGQGTVPTATTPRDEMLAAIFETLTEEQMASLQNVLSPSQLANLAMLAQDLQAARGAGQPGAAGPGTPAQSGRPSDETAYLAIDQIKKNLLPWAMECIKASKPLTPPITLAKPVRIFHLFVGALSHQQYEDLLVGDVPFDQAEKDAFVKLAETFNLVPPPVPSTAAKPGKGPGTGQPQK